MKVIIDEREIELFEKCESLIRSSRIPSSVELSKEVLDLGDILIKTDDNKDVLLIERKSFQDLLASIKDGRYEEQSYRLLHSSGFPPHSVFYLVEGMFSQLRAPLEKKIIMSAISVLFCVILIGRILLIWQRLIQSLIKLGSILIKRLLCMAQEATPTHTLGCLP